MPKMTDAHKEALARGREQARIVRRYLEALARHRRPGRRRDRRTLEKRLAELNARIEQESNPARRVELVQKRLDLEAELAAMAPEQDFEALEAAFVEVAKEYSERRGISYAAWREVGVPPNVLKRAGIPRR